MIEVHMAEAHMAVAHSASLPSPALSCRNLSVNYGQRAVLDDVSLDLHAGRWTAIVGPNGCGKSTLLRAFAGLAKIRSGSIAFHVRRLSAGARRASARRRAQ